MLVYKFPAENKDALNALMGVLTTIFTLQQNYFFGSSSASRTKDETIGAIAQATTVPSSPINIPNADSVNVKTESGDVSIDSKPKPSIMPLKEEITQ